MMTVRRLFNLEVFEKLHVSSEDHDLEMNLLPFSAKVASSFYTTQVDCYQPDDVASLDY